MSKDASLFRSPSDIRVGFVELIDAAPLIAAKELGYFADEGLRVTLELEIGWGNVRDKLIFGHLQASHALLGMPPLSVLGREKFPEPIVTLMGLGIGGNAITFGRKLTDAGVNTSADLARHVHSRTGPGRVLLAHVFDSSMHHYLLRDWLAAGGVDPDRDVRFCVLPPTQMNRQLELGSLDGFCTGEPWNTVSEREGAGKIVAVTSDILNDHPEKVLAVSRRWLAKSPAAAEGLLRATLRACGYCSEPGNLPAVAEMLSRPAYLNMPVDLVMRSLTMDRWFGGASRRPAGPIRSCAPEKTFPAVAHGVWLLGQMVRWNHLPQDTDVAAVAAKAVDVGPYRKAAKSLNLQCPPDDLPPMQAGSGSFDPKLQPPELKTIGETFGAAASSSPAGLTRILPGKQGA